MRELVVAVSGAKGERQWAVATTLDQPENVRRIYGCKAIGGAAIPVLTPGTIVKAIVELNPAHKAEKADGTVTEYGDSYTLLFMPAK